MVKSLYVVLLIVNFIYSHDFIFEYNIYLDQKFHRDGA